MVARSPLPRTCWASKGSPLTVQQSAVALDDVLKYLRVNDTPGWHAEHEGGEGGTSLVLHVGDGWVRRGVVVVWLDKGGRGGGGGYLVLHVGDGWVRRGGGGGVGGQGGGRGLPRASCG